MDDFKRPLSAFQVNVNNLGLIIRDSEFKFIQFLLTCGILGLFNESVIIFQALPLLAIIVSLLAEKQDPAKCLSVDYAQQKTDGCDGLAIFTMDILGLDSRLSIDGPHFLHLPNRRGREHVFKSAALLLHGACLRAKIIRLNWRRAD